MATWATAIRPVASMCVALEEASDFDYLIIW